MNALFFSKYCQHCDQLMLKLRESEFIDKIDFICVDVRNHQKNGKKTLDAVKVDQLISRYKITTVPTIVLGNKKASGSNCFNIIKQFSNTKKEANQQQNSIQQSQQVASPEGPSGVSSELFGYSDNYSYLGSEVPQEKGFNYLNKDSKQDVEEVQEMTFAEEQPANAKNNDVASDYERMMIERSNFDNARSGRRAIQ